MVSESVALDPDVYRLKVRSAVDRRCGSSVLTVRIDPALIYTRNPEAKLGRSIEGSAHCVGPLDAARPSSRIIHTSAQRSRSGSHGHAGMAPRPRVIFQNRAPSGSLCTSELVRSRGRGLSAAAARPSPLPAAPWHVAQLAANSCAPTSAADRCSGLRRARACGGARHGSCERPIDKEVSTPRTTTSRAEDTQRSTEAECFKIITHIFDPTQPGSLRRLFKLIRRGALASTPTRRISAHVPL